jgi:beta-lactamase regulating signal transducer with metallopeptidase domain
MILEYSIRLACICLASFFLVHLAAALVAIRVSPWIISVSARMRPQQAARLLLTLRLAPVCSALCVVIALCVPSYLRYEQNGAAEKVGIFCLVASVLGLALCMISVGRGLRAVVHSLRITRQCPSVEAATAWGKVSAAKEDVAGMPLLALVGIVRPELILSRRVLEVLSPEQLDAALSHERAHQISRDNLKRLLVVLAPNVFPFVNGFGELEHQWERFIELAADDHATCGQIGRSVALAEALIQVARLGNAEAALPLASSLCARGQDLAARIHRLLGLQAEIAPSVRRATFPWMFSFALLGLSVLLLHRPDVLYPVHGLLETLLH